MHIFKTKFLSLAFLHLLLFSNVARAQTESFSESVPQSVPESVPQSVLETVPENVSEPESSPKQIILYERAKKELDSDFYALYRIMDRIARANQFDDRSWLVTVIPKSHNTDTSSNPNSIEIDRRSLRQLNGDSSGVACIVGREIARRTQNYKTLDEKQKQELIAKIKEDAEKEVLGAKKNTFKHNAIRVVGGIVTDHFLPRFVSDFAGSVIGSRRGNKKHIGRRTQKRIDEIVAKRTKELEQSWADKSREQELEIDKLAYFATVRAGFEPEGCLRAMTVLARNNKDGFDTENLTVSQRITALESSMEKYPLPNLLAEGEAKISKAQPLAYSLSEDGESLEINYSESESVANDIDSRFDN